MSIFFLREPENDAHRARPDDIDQYYLLCYPPNESDIDLTMRTINTRVTALRSHDTTLLAFH